MPTDQQEFYFGLRGRYRFGEGRAGPEVYLDGAFDLFEFSFGYDELQQLERTSVIPPLSFGTIHLGAGLSYLIESVNLTLDAHLAYRMGIVVGFETRQVWGSQTSQMSAVVLGFDANLGLPSVAEGLFIGFGLEYMRYSTKFEGQNDCAVPGCAEGDPWEQWPHVPGDDLNVTGGILEPVVDHFVRSQVRIGYEFR